MPPKARAKSTPKADAKKKGTLKKGYPSGNIAADEKQQILDYLESVTSEEATEDDVEKTFKLLEQGCSENDRKLLKAACTTIQTICEDEQGLHTFIEAKGLETILSFTRHLKNSSVSKSMADDISSTASAIYRQFATWLENLDEVDFHELPVVLKLAEWLGADDEDVAVASLSAMERYVLYRPDHTVTLLNEEVLTIIHRIMGHQRSPELVTEAFILLFRLCDMGPKTLVMPMMSRESGLIQTVVEAMLQAPLNMRMQLAGLRLLCLWGQMSVLEQEPAPGELPVPGAAVLTLREPLKQAKAFETGQTIVANLSRSGLTHAASWMSAIASRLPRPGSVGGHEPRRKGSDLGGRRASASGGRRKSISK